MIDLTLLENPFENVYVFKKWNWDYLEAQAFQLECLDHVHKNPHVTILIICSHPHCFTVGRGLQKIKSEVGVELIDFKKDTHLPYPIHTIKRGGGLTFHYPGQFVFYPILNLTKNKLAVYDVMLKIMGITKEIIQKQFSFQGLSIKKDLLGLWFENEFSKAKIASIGLAVTRFNTYHGLALNFFSDKEMFDCLKSIHPCGLPGNLYRDLEILLCREISIDQREIFCQNFMEAFLDYLIMERHKSSSMIKDSISETVSL